MIARAQRTVLQAAVNAEMDCDATFGCGGTKYAFREVRQPRKLAATNAKMEDG